jgi:hypothetical protein
MKVASGGIRTNIEISSSDEMFEKRKKYVLQLLIWNLLIWFKEFFLED